MIEYRCPDCQKQYEVDDTFAGMQAECEVCKAEIEVPYPPLELPLEVTPGGSLVHRHEPGQRAWEPTSGNDGNIELISNHIEHHLGKVETVFHELVSDQVHIDVHSVPPTEDRPFRTLVTSGMSDRMMSTPRDAEDYGFLELMLCLPPDWPLAQDDLANENHYWPVRWLKLLARFPHEFNTWLFYGHTLPNGEPPAPLADNNQFAGWLLMPPRLVPDLFRELDVEPEKTIFFAAAVPLFAEEMELKLEVGTEALLEKMTRRGVTELIDVHRINLATDDAGALE